MYDESNRIESVELTKLEVGAINRLEDESVQDATGSIALGDLKQKRTVRQRL